MSLLLWMLTLLLVGLIHASCGLYRRGLMRAEVCIWMNLMASIDIALFLTYLTR